MQTTLIVLEAAGGLVAIVTIAATVKYIRLRLLLKELERQEMMLKENLAKICLKKDNIEMDRRIGLPIHVDETSVNEELQRFRKKVKNLVPDTAWSKFESKKEARVGSMTVGIHEFWILVYGTAEILHFYMILSPSVNKPRLQERIEKFGSATYGTGAIIGRQNTLRGKSEILNGINGLEAERKAQEIEANDLQKQFERTIWQIQSHIEALLGEQDTGQQLILDSKILKRNEAFTAWRHSWIQIQNSCSGRLLNIKKQFKNSPEKEKALSKLDPTDRRKTEIERDINLLKEQALTYRENIKVAEKVLANFLSGNEKDLSPIERFAGEIVRIETNLDYWTDMCETYGLQSEDETKELKEAIAILHDDNWGMKFLWYGCQWMTLNQRLKAIQNLLEIVSGKVNAAGIAQEKSRKDEKKAAGNDPNGTFSIHGGLGRHGKVFTP